MLPAARNQIFGSARSADIIRGYFHPAGAPARVARHHG